MGYPFNPSKIKEFLLPEGTYQVKVRSSVISQTKNGKDMWKMQLAIEAPQYVGKIIFCDMVLQENTESIVKGYLTSLGLDTKSDITYDLTTDVLSRKCNCEIFHEAPNAYHDGTQAKVKRLRSIKLDEVQQKVADIFPELEDSEEMPF